MNSNQNVLPNISTQIQVNKVLILFSRILMEKWRPLCHAVSWGVPIVVAISTACSGVLGYDNCIEVGVYRSYSI